MFGELAFMLGAEVGWAVGATLPVSPPMASGSVLKAEFLLSTRSIAAPSPAGLCGLEGEDPKFLKSDADPCESLVRFFLRKPRDGIWAVELGRFTGT